MIRTKRIQRHQKIRHTVAGTAERPRLSVYRGNRNLFVQLIDDTHGTTLFGVSSSTLTGKLAGRERAKRIAEQIIVFGREKGLSSFVFDRGGFHYHGQVKEIAEAVRTAGFQI